MVRNPFLVLLEELDTEFGNIKIVRSKLHGTCTYYQESCLHSQINTKGSSTCGYVHVMASVIRQAKARRVLVIGCAGGTLATMLHRAGCDVTVVDINPYAFALARKYFQMPEKIRCIVGDGYAYLLETGNCYDAIAIDVFSSDGTVPESFTTADFFQVVHKSRNPNGVIVMNVMVEHDLDMLADRVALTMQSAGLPAVLFDRPGLYDRNVIIAGGNVRHVQIASYRKPIWVMDELEGIIRRVARTNIPG